MDIRYKQEYVLSEDWRTCDEELEYKLATISIGTIESYN